MNFINKRVASIKTFGDSMYPLLFDGDIVYYRKIPISKIKVSDLIGFKKNNQIINHRVVYKTETYLLTKGDNNSKVDSKVYPQNILGKISHVKRGGKIIVPETLYLIQSSRYFAEIVQIKNILLENKIDFVILKGLPIHLHYEGRFPRRIYADCDILINKKQFGSVEKLFRQLGYKQMDSLLTSTHKKLKDKEPEVQFAKSIGGFVVTFDIHLEAVFLMTQLGSLEALYPQRLIDAFSSKLLEEKKTIKIEGEHFPILSTENLIIYLALHLFHHNFNGYYRYEILKKVMQTKKIDCLKLSEMIVRFQLNNYTFPVFLLLKKYYRISLPGKVMRKIKSTERIEQYINSKILNLDIFSDDSRLNSGVERFTNIYYLSPQPFWTKSQIVFSRQFLFSFFFVISKKTELFFRRNFRQKIKIF